MVQLLINAAKINIGIHRCYATALYMTGNHAKDQYLALTPYLDISRKLENKEILEENLQRRRIDINIEELYKKYFRFKDLLNERNKLDCERLNIAGKIKQNVDTTVIEKLKSEGKLIRKELKSLKENLYVIEDEFIHLYLNLPNDIHEKTPLETSTLQYHEEFANKLADNNVKDDLQFNNLIDFNDNSSYYLKGKAALFDIFYPMSCVQYFLENGFVQFSNPDFIRNAVVEAAVYNDKVFSIEEKLSKPTYNLLNLAGGGSFVSFLPFFARLSIYAKFLPLRLVSSGRSYSFSENNQIDDIFTAWQTNKLQVFIVNENEEEANKDIENLFKLIVKIYKPLNINFRIVYNPAYQLNAAESLKVSIEMYSETHKNYIEIGGLSYYSDFISKRILFNIKDKTDVIKFPTIISGNILDTKKIISCFSKNKGNFVAEAIFNHKK